MDLGLILDIVIVCVFLIFAIIGLKKGFTITIIKIFGMIVAFIVAILLSKLTVDLLASKTPLINNVTNSFTNMFNKKGGAFLMAVSNADELRLALVSVKMPEILITMFIKPLGLFIKDGTTLGGIFGELCSKACFWVGCWFIYYLILATLIMLLRKFAKILLKFSPLKFLDRLIGMVFYAIIGYFVLAILSVALVRFIDKPFMSKVKQGVDKTRICKEIVYKNPLNDLLDKIMGTKKTEPQNAGSINDDTFEEKFVLSFKI